MRAVLAHVRGHQPAEVGATAGADRLTRQVERRHAEVDLRGVAAERVAVTRQSAVGGAVENVGRRGLLDEGDVPPRARTECAGVVVGRAEQREAVVGDGVPLLARHLARLAADADGGVGEEPLARRRVGPAGVRSRVERAVEGVAHCWPSVVVSRELPVSVVMPARRRYSST